MIVAVDRFEKGTDSYTAGILSLWELAFGDDEATIRKFLLSCPKRAYLRIEEDEVAAMLFVLPSRLRLNGAEYQTGYIYAAATHPSLRGQGVMSALVRHAHEDMNHLPYFSLLPASASLYDFYAKLGYQPVFSRSTAVFTRESLSQAAAGAFPVPIPFDFSRFSAFREGLADNALLWGDEALRYVLEDHQSSGGRAVMFGGGYLLYKVQDGKAVISEFNLPAEDFAGAAAWLINETDCQSFEFRGPAGSLPRGVLKPYGMLWARGGGSTIPKNFYFNLGLD